MKKILMCGVFIFVATSLFAQKVEYKNLVAKSVKQVESMEKVDYLYNFTKIDFDLRKLNAQTRVRVFIDMILPAVKIVNMQNMNLKKKIKELSTQKTLTPTEQKFAKSIFKKYNVKYGAWDKLIKNIIIYPNSLLLAQAGLESGWGTSRFFREGFNIFGMWATNDKEPRIRAEHKRPNGKYVYVRKYQSPIQAIQDFILNLSRNKAYVNLRKYIDENKTPYEIAQGLYNYSEQHQLYVWKIRRTMKSYNLTQYDGKYN